MTDELPIETMSIENRSDFFAQWAIERSRAIVADQGGNLALATRDMSDEKIAETASALARRLSMRFWKSSMCSCPRSDLRAK